MTKHVLIKPYEGGEWKDLGECRTTERLTAEDSVPDPWFKFEPISFTCQGKCDKKTIKRLLRQSSFLNNMVLAYKRAPYRGVWHMPYGIYRKCQMEAHTVFGCNLKRFLRSHGCGTKVKHLTRNGKWVWMK